MQNIKYYEMKIREKQIKNKWENINIIDDILRHNMDRNY